MSSFPVIRPRRLRRTEGLRRLVRESVLAPSQLVYPIFVVEGTSVQEPIRSMPGIFRKSPDLCAEEAHEAERLGLGGLLLFGVPSHKDSTGSSGRDPDGLVPRAISAIRRAAPTLPIVTDVCLCDYTDHGHCGLLTPTGDVQNDETLPLLVEQALSHARAGADVVAPSDMMDGRVGAIRRGLDDAGFSQVSILSYAVKYASAFYGPFREAAHNAPKQGDRRGYQMDPANAREALREVALDLEEGADMVMVKPAIAYLDIVRQVRDRFEVPLLAYNVSGEYSMIRAAAEQGFIDGSRAMMECLMSIRRAGADAIVTYFALEAAKALTGK
ncbi:MAG: porphobilinogen synthase [Deltaproteobacteria bacterium]